MLVDLTMPLASEKSPLPAIIVTPSSPTVCDSPFFIAFSPKPTLRERVSNYVSPFQSPFQLRARTTIILSILLFIVVCHLFTHQFAIHRPHIRFDNFEVGHAHNTETPYWGWFGIKSLWNASMPDEKRDFIINESLTA